MKKKTWRTSEVHNLSSHGVVTRAQLREAKVSDSALTARCSPGGPWQRLLPGVYLLHNGFPSQLQRSTAALAYGGSDSVITGRVGLAAHGFAADSTSNEIHILIPDTVRRASTSFVRVERTWRRPTPMTKGSLRVSPLVRCLVDTTRAAKTEDQCVRLIAEVVQREGATLREISSELAQGPRRYGALSKRAVRELSDDAHSVAELNAQRLYSRSGLPPMMHNVAIYSATGQFICATENWLDSVALAWEVDSLAHHLLPRDHTKTMERRTRMQSHALIVASHLPREIRDNGQQVIEDLHAHYQLALSRPRPPVIARQRSRG
ncbi:hypothetical protein [Rhodococcoides fascians]|uniref:hypothetical protein n=1 Tax=Rhodococcoides fascians TaxID=1828 RepID=UPI00056C3084|nr:hypothetical protein [Rhodococcus fascians]